MITKHDEKASASNLFFLNAGKFTYRIFLSTLISHNPT